ncbi:MAG: cytochrome c [Magnetospirillum sp. WYHS-4]
MSHGRQTILRPLGAFAVLLGLAAGPAWADEAADKALAEKRVMSMKDVRSSMATLRRMVRGQAEFAQQDAVDAVQVLLTELDDMPKTFSGGPSKAPSDSKPEIWTDWNGFMKILGESKDAANGLMVSVRSTSSGTALKEKYENLDKACEACHAKFRK